jgi:MHS family proline/betaine transporter-like MFS transporter
VAHPVPDRRRVGRRRVVHPAQAQRHSRVRSLREEGEVAASPLKEAVTTSWRPILQIAGLVVIHNVGFYIVFTYLPTYFTRTLEFSKLNAFVSITIASMVALVLIPPLGALSDRIGRKPLL